MVELIDDGLNFSFPEVHPEAQLRIEFQRTLRIPDDGEVHFLPPGLGTFPLKHVDDFGTRVPSPWVTHGGVLLPMYQSEALWIGLDGTWVDKHGTEYPFAVKVAAGKIDAVTGKTWTNDLGASPQNYMVVPEQPWLDGFCVDKGIIRQFVAMPLGGGYTAEEQVTGKAEYGGLQILVHPMRRDAFERRFPERPAGGYARESEGHVCFSPPSADMGLAPGGRMNQEIFEDPFGIDEWDRTAGSRCYVHMANSLVWEAITGEKPPTPPPTAKTYTDNGLPWFDYYAEGSKALDGAEELKRLKSVLEMGNQKGDTPLPENESVTPDRVIRYRGDRAKSFKPLGDAQFMTRPHLACVRNLSGGYLMIRHVGILCLFLLVTWPASGSAQTGSVTGSVVDQTGLVLSGTTVTLRGDGVPRTVYSDERGDFELSGGIAPGTYTLTVSLTGFSDATVNDVVVSDGVVVLPEVVLQLASFGDTVVVTASRNEVRLIDAPVSMSVISTATLETTPAQNYGDLLRATPGVNVIQLSARDVQVTSRSPGNTLTNSQLVLVDGRSVYLDFFGLVMWDLLPTNFDDVEQIEVVRGPASAVWGANAMTGAVNIITKPPRESVGTTVTLSGGYIDRNDGSSVGLGAGSMFGANATVTRAPSDRLSYRVSGGYFRSDAFARPTGRIPVIDDPRQPGQTVGGAFYPLDSGTAAFGTGFANRGTSQPKFEVRVDQELSDATITYSGGVAGTEGIVHSGIGPFDMQSGTYMGYGKLNYTRGDLQIQFFANFLDGKAPNLLLPDIATGMPLQLDFKSQTFDGEIGHSVFLGSRHRLNYGGNVRQNNFDITLAPLGENRLEVGGYLQDEIFWERFRLVLGGRVDKFGNLSDPKFSPRIAFIVKPAEDHSVTLSYNRAFRAPSVINNALQTNIVSPVDLSALAPLLPPVLQPAVAQPFPLVVGASGSDIPIGGMPQDELTEESLTAYEVSYTGVLPRGTTLGGSFFVNRRDDSINFTALPPSLDPYTAASPPPGWRLPPLVLTQMAQLGIFLPRTAFTYLNLGPIRQTGMELWLEQKVSRSLAASINYSWQSEPEILDNPNPYLPAELNLPPTHRFNAAMTWNGSRLLGSASVNAATDAFWSDVLTSAYHGYTDGYATVNGSFGVKWQGGTVTTTVKVTNLFNQTVQQHIFGDLLRRTVVGEMKFRF